LLGQRVAADLCISWMLGYVHYSDLNIMLIFSLEGIIIGDNMSKNKPIVVGFNTYRREENHA